MSVWCCVTFSQQYCTNEFVRSTLPAQNAAYRVNFGVMARQEIGMPVKRGQ